MPSMYVLISSMSLGLEVSTNEDVVISSLLPLQKSSLIGFRML